MVRTVYCVVIALLLAGASARAQSGDYTTQFRVSPPAPTAPNPFSHAPANPSQPLFGKPTPQRFSASPFPDANHNLGIFIRNRIIAPQHPGHVGAPPADIYVPYPPYPNVCPIDPYGYNLPGSDPASGQTDGITNQSSSFRLEASTDPGGTPESKTSTVTFKSTPAGAELYIDGNLVGNTPSTMPLASGLHTISIQQWGYQAWQQTLTVSAGGKIIIDATLREN